MTEFSIIPEEDVKKKPPKSSYPSAYAVESVFNIETGKTRKAVPANVMAYDLPILAIPSRMAKCMYLIDLDKIYSSRNCQDHRKL